MNVFERLYFGHIQPSRKKASDNPEIKAMYEEIERQTDHLGANLNDIGKRELEKLTSAYGELEALLDYESYRDGFRLGVALMIECMSGSEDMDC